MTIRIIGAGLIGGASVVRVIEGAEQVPAPSRAPMGADADEMLRAAHEKSDAELDALRLQIVGLPRSRYSRPDIARLLKPLSLYGP
jgi:hypothetical protein